MTQTYNTNHYICGIDLGIYATQNDIEIIHKENYIKLKKGDSYIVIMIDGDIESDTVHVYSDVVMLDELRFHYLDFNPETEKLQIILKKKYDFEVYQSNVEGELINKLQEADNNYDGILINAGGYTHTSVAITDAIEAISTPVIEVHISNIFDRESFRNKSLISKNCAGHISGFGLKSYEIGLKHLLEM